MDYSNKLHEIDQLLNGGHTTQAVTASGQVLEELLRHLYQQVLPKLAPADQKELADKIEKAGGARTVDKLTLGQLVGVFRETKLVEKCEKHLKLDLPRLRRADLTTITDLRNQATHGGIVSEDDARWIASQIRVFVREAGLLAEKPKLSSAETTTLTPWTRCVRLNHDVESGNTAIAAYAIDLGGVVAGDREIHKIYREADAFFRVTYPTNSMRRLMEEVLARLAGKSGDRVLQLRSPFGGGKSHLLLALYHAVNDRQALLANWPQASQLPDPGRVRVAVFDGEKFDVQGREVAQGIRIKTMWGWLAWQLGGATLYQHVAYHDERKIAPGGDVIVKLIRDGDAPTLILLDEVLKYFERAQADSDVVGQSTLGRQTLDFIQSLGTEVAHSARAVMIYSLQASARESFGNVALLEMLDHLTARVDAKREPIVGDEILPVLQRRLLAELTDPRAADQVAEAYARVITTMRMSHATDAAARRAIEDEGSVLQKRFRTGYPFHPMLIDIMSQRWASLPDFQRTRGALRFLATCLYVLKRDDQASALIGPGDIPLFDADVRNAFFTEVGQREPFAAVLTHDFIGPNARARRIDERLAREHPHLSGVHPAMRLATAILMYTFGGATRAGESNGEVLGVGVTETELLSAVVGPHLDSITAQATLKELREQCLYLHYDGARYVFKTTPNINKLLEDEAESNVRAEEIRAAIKDELTHRLSGRLGAIVWPETSAHIPDKEPRFLLAYLPLEFAALGDRAQQERISEYFERYGNDLRKYRNGLGLAIPDSQQIEPLRRAARYLKAVELLRNKRAQLNLTREQLEQLKEREATEKAAFESALRGLYTVVCLPQMTNGTLTVEQLEMGGRPLGASGIHERLTELITTVYPRVFSSVKPTKIIELFRLGEPGEGGAPLGVTTNDLRDAFYSIIGFPRLEDEGVLRRAIVAGVKEGTFGFVGRADRIERDRVREGSGYFVGRGQVLIDKELREDEIDLSAGFIVLPAGIEAEPSEPPRGTEPPPLTPALPEPSAGVTYVIPRGGVDAGQTQTRVRFKVTLNRQQVYASFNAFANLADKAGTIELIVDAQALQGFDPVWLRNAVIEPLEEADVKIQREGSQS